MAETPVGALTFLETRGERKPCPDCAVRLAELPAVLPEVGDDFDWRARDYDSLRLFMAEELAARFPERHRWTPGDMEIVLVEVLAALLDQLSDMADRVAAEAFLETARRPESVRRLLGMIGYDAVRAAKALGQIPEGTEDPDEELAALWLGNPHLMDAARQAGPRAIHTQHRMVTVEDYAQRLEDHPLVLRASARVRWTGSWNSVRVTVVLWEDMELDKENPNYTDEVKADVDRFHQERGLAVPAWEAASPPTIRTILRPYLDAYRMVAREVTLEDAVRVPITMSFSIRVVPTYFRSEIAQVVSRTLGTGPEGFFKPGRLRFGEDLYLSDLLEVLMALDGVENVCVNRFKRMGSQYPDQTEFGRIELDGLEIAICKNDPNEPKDGFWRLILHGGRRG